MLLTTYCSMSPKTAKLKSLTKLHLILIITHILKKKNRTMMCYGLTGQRGPKKNI